MKILHFANMKRLLASALSLTYFYSNVLALHASERSFWAERRSATQRFKESGSTEEARALPSQRNPGGLEPEQYLALAQLPQMGHVEIGVPQPASVGTGLSLAPNVSDVQSMSTPPSWISKLILPYGSIGEIHLSKKANAPLVIHIQDAHGIEEAQRNIASMIQGLKESQGVNLVGLEGASGAFDLDTFRGPDLSVAHDLADHFLKEGKIAGPEYAGLTAPHPPALFGVEDPPLYVSNVQALLDARKEKPAMDKTLADLNSVVAPLKTTLYSSELKEYDRHFQAYGAQKEGLAEYVRYLVHTHGEDPKKFPNMGLLMKALVAEKSLDFKQVERERRTLVEMLAGGLSKAKLNLLVERSLQYRAGQMGYGDYHRFLLSLCRENKIPFEKLTEMKAYIEYVLLAEKINRNALLDELTQLERDTQDRLAVTVEQKKLVSIARRMGLLNKLASQAMTTTDWETYESQKDGVYHLGSDIKELGGLTDANVSPEFLAPFESFCLNAIGRNKAFVRNLTDQIKTQKTSSAILVAGGFHTQGLTGLLRENDFSYVVATPKITEVPKDDNYLDVFARDPLPLEKLFMGDKIFLKINSYVAHTMPGTNTEQRNAFLARWIANQGALLGLLTPERALKIAGEANQAAIKMDSPARIEIPEANSTQVTVKVDLDQDEVNDVTVTANPTSALNEQRPGARKGGVTEPIGQNTVTTSRATPTFASRVKRAFSRSSQARRDRLHRASGSAVKVTPAPGTLPLATLKKTLEEGQSWAAPFAVFVVGLPIGLLIGGISGGFTAILIGVVFFIGTATRFPLAIFVANSLTRFVLVGMMEVKQIRRDANRFVQGHHKQHQAQVREIVDSILKWEKFGRESIFSKLLSTAVIFFLVSEILLGAGYYRLLSTGTILLISAIVAVLVELSLAGRLAKMRAYIFHVIAHPVSNLGALLNWILTPSGKRSILGPAYATLSETVSEQEAEELPDLSGLDSGEINDLKSRLWAVWGHEPSELEVWRAFMVARGESKLPGDVVSSVSSKLFSIRRMGNDVGIVNIVFETVLKRAPSEREVSFIQSLASNGQTKADLAAVEAHARRVATQIMLTGSVDGLIDLKSEVRVLEILTDKLGRVPNEVEVLTVIDRARATGESVMLMAEKLGDNWVSQRPPAGTTIDTTKQKSLIIVAFLSQLNRFPTKEDVRQVFDLAKSVSSDTTTQRNLIGLFARVLATRIALREEREQLGGDAALSVNHQRLSLKFLIQSKIEVVDGRSDEEIQKAYLTMKARQGLLQFAIDESKRLVGDNVDGAQTYLNSLRRAIIENAFRPDKEFYYALRNVLDDLPEDATRTGTTYAFLYKLLKSAIQSKMTLTNAGIKWKNSPSGNLNDISDSPFFKRGTRTVSGVEPLTSPQPAPARPAKTSLSPSPAAQRKILSRLFIGIDNSPIGLLKLATDNQIQTAYANAMERRERLQEVTSSLREAEGEEASGYLDSLQRAVLVSAFKSDGDFYNSLKPIRDRLANSRYNNISDLLTDVIESHIVYEIATAGINREFTADEIFQAWEATQPEAPRITRKPIQNQPRGLTSTLLGQVLSLIIYVVATFYVTAGYGAINSFLAGIVVFLLLTFGLLGNYKWAKAIVHFMSSGFLAGFLEYFKVTGNFGKWVKEHEKDIQSKVREAGKMFLLWQNIGANSKFVNKFVPFAAGSGFFFQYMVGLGGAQLLPIYAIVFLSLLVGLVARFLGSIVMPPFSGFLFHAGAHSLYNLNLMWKRARGIDKSPVGAYATGTQRAETAASKEKVELLAQQWAASGDLNVLKELLDGLIKANPVQWNGVRPSAQIPRSMEPTFTLMDTTGQAELSTILGRLDHSGISSDALANNLNQGISVAAWRETLTNAPGVFRLFDANALDSENAETRMAARAAFTALSAEIQAKNDPRYARQITIGYDNDQILARVLEDFPSLRSVQMKQNQLTSNNELAVGQLATEEQEAGASSLAVYTVRRLDTNGAPENFVKKHEYSLGEVIRQYQQIIARIAAYA